MGILALGSAKKCICRTAFCKISLIGFAITAKMEMMEGFSLGCSFFSLKWLPFEARFVIDHKMTRFYLMNMRMLVACLFDLQATSF